MIFDHEDYPIVTIFRVVEEKELVFITLENQNIRLVLTNVGASIVSLVTRDDQNQPADIVLGYDDPDRYLDNTENYMGSVIGRCANRIKEGKFTLHGVNYQLAVNNGPNHLHGGDAPLSTKIWDYELGPKSVVFKTTSLNGEGGYPGTIEVKVTYLLMQDGWHMFYDALSDADTIFNPTSHVYFNLDGHDAGTLQNHTLQVYADSYLPIDETLIPTGEIINVENTPFDFRKARRLYPGIDGCDEQLRRGKGYDHCFVVPKKLVAVLTSLKTKRFIMMRSTMPGLQIYTGNYLDAAGKQGVYYGERSGIAMEGQFFPNAINEPHFPSVILAKKQPFHHEAMYTTGILNGKYKQYRPILDE